VPGSNLHPSSRSKPRLFWLVLVFGALIRFLGLGHKQLWLDELIQAVRSSPSSLSGVLESVADDRAQAPLDYIVQHYLARLLGQSEFALRFHAALFGTLTILVLYYLVRSVFDEKVALITSILYAVYPLHHNYSQESRPYALFTLLTVCSYLLFWRLLSAGKARTWFAYIVVTALLFYANYFGMFVVFSQFVFTCTLLAPRISESSTEIRKVDLTFVSRLLAAITASIALFTPWIVMGIRTNLVYSPLPERFGFKLFLRFVKELSDRSFPLSIVLITFAVLGILKLRSDKRFGHLSFLLCWFLLPLPLIFLLLYIEDYFFAIRQILFATPAFFILISLGILYLSEIAVKAKGTRRAAVARWAVACVGLMSITQIGLHFPDRREDLKGTGQFLKRKVSVGDVVIAPGLGNVLSFYFPEIYAHLQPGDEGSRRNGGPYTEIHAHLQPVMSLGDLSASLSSGKRIFVVKSHYMTTAEQQFLSWVPADDVTAHQKEFKGIEIIELEETGKGHR
jgi:mannosyltransferase